jgi:hypothetical protein
MDSNSAPIILYQGNKCFWRTRNTLNLFIIHHCLHQTIEVIAIHEKSKQESVERLYLNSLRLINSLDSNEIDEKVKEKRTHCEQSNQHYEISSLRTEVQHQCSVDYILSRLNMKMLSSPPTFAFGNKIMNDKMITFEIILSSFSGDTVNEETKKLEVLCSKPVNLLPFVVSPPPSYHLPTEKKMEPTGEECSKTTDSFSSTDCSTISSTSDLNSSTSSVSSCPQKRKSSLILLSPLLPRRGSIDDSYLNMSSSCSPLSKYSVLSSPSPSPSSASPSTTPTRPYTSTTGRSSLTENEMIASFHEMKENKNQNLLGINGAEGFSKTNKFSKNQNVLPSLKTLTKVIIATKRLSAFNFPSFSMNKEKSQNRFMNGGVVAGDNETEEEDDNSDDDEDEPTRRIGGGNEEPIINSFTLEPQASTSPSLSSQQMKICKLSVRHIDDPSVSSFSAIEMLKREQVANGLNRNNSNSRPNTPLRPSTSTSSLSPTTTTPSRGNFSKLKSTKALVSLPSSSSLSSSRLSPLRTNTMKKVV